MQSNVTAKANGIPSRAQYVHLLAGGGEELHRKANLEDPDFWQEAWNEGILACIWHGLQQRGVAVEPAIRQALVEPPLRSQTAHTLMLRSAAAEVLRLSAEAGIDVVMLRGQALAENLYAPPTLRPQTDIDLLVAEADAPRFAECLSTAGFSVVPEHPLLFFRKQVLLDVHIEPLGIERIASWALLTPLRAGDFFRHARRGRLLGEPAILPEARVSLPYLCFHAAKHSFERLIWLWDIALLARSIGSEQAWGAVADGIAEYALERPCFYALSYADAHLAAGVPPGLLERMRPPMDWRERQLFRRFMDHEQIPFLAERLFARMQPDVMHRMAFWRETIWPRAEVRRQVDADPSARGGFAGKRMAQISRAAGLLLREMMALFRR